MIIQQGPSNRHLASWNLPYSQFCLESKIEPCVTKAQNYIGWGNPHRKIVYLMGGHRIYLFDERNNCTILKEKAQLFGVVQVRSKSHSVAPSCKLKLVRYSAQLKIQAGVENYWGQGILHSYLGLLIRCSNQGGDTAQNSKMFEKQRGGHRTFQLRLSGQMFKLGWGHRTILKEEKLRWSGGRPACRFRQKIIPLRGSILQAGTFQNLSLAENLASSNLQMEPQSGIII